MRALFLFGCKKVRASELYFLYLTVYSLFFFLPFFCCAAVFKHFPISAVNLCVCLTVCLLRLLKEEGRRKKEREGVNSVLKSVQPLNRKLISFSSFAGTF